DDSATTLGKKNGTKKKYEKEYLNKNCKASPETRCSTDNPDRSDTFRNQGHYRHNERHSRGRVRALPENQKFPLAHERSAFPRLSFASRRARRRAFRDDRSDCGANSKAGRTHHQIDWPHLTHPTRAR